MKKLLYYAVLLFIFVSCKVEISDGESDFAPQGNDIASSGETTELFTETDTRCYEYSFPTREDFCMADGYIQAFQTDPAQSKYISNWVLGKNYKNLKGTGFEAYVKLNENMNYAGFELFKKDSFDSIEFALYSTGDFEIKQTGASKIKISASSSHADVSKFNIIKVRTCDSGKVEVYLNGFIVKTLDSADMSFPLTSTDKVCVMYNVKNTISESSPAKAWFKLINLEQN